MANPTEKTKYEADVVIDGEEVKDVAFKTKGNSSLFDCMKRRIGSIESRICAVIGNR